MEKTKEKSKSSVSKIPWGWTDMGVKVRDTEYTLKPEATAEELVQYLEELEIDSEVFMGLVAARTAFSVGGADNYVNAGSRLRDLIISMKQTEQKLSDMSNRFSNYFSPEGLNVSFKGQNQEYSKMTRKLIVRMVDALTKKPKENKE